jgi:hypothetical protein
MQSRAWRSVRLEAAKAIYIFLVPNYLSRVRISKASEFVFF